MSLISTGVFILEERMVNRLPSDKVLLAKKQVVATLTEKLKNAKSVVFADYRGLTVAQDTEFRSTLRKSGIEYTVVKNSLLSFAAKENGLDNLQPFLNGPTSMAISYDDLVAPAKVLVEYSKKYEKLELKTGIVEGNVIDLSQVFMLAELPSKEVLIAQMLGSMNAPITGFVTVLSGVIRSLAIALNAIAEQKAQA